MSRSTLVALAGVEHRDQETAGRFVIGIAEPGQRPADSRGLQAGELERQRLPLRGDEQQPLPAVGALPLLDIALVDQLLEHAPERLLGDLENAEQLGDLHAGIAIDEVQHAVMSAPEAELRQDLVGVADEIAIGKEEQLDQIPERLRLVPDFARPDGDVQIYVSHVDIFLGFVTMVPC